MTHFLLAGRLHQASGPLTAEALLALAGEACAGVRALVQHTADGQSWSWYLGWGELIRPREGDVFVRQYGQRLRHGREVA